MKTLIFTLTMPGRSSWNGKWSGDGECFAIKRRVKDATAERLSGKHFGYNFGDGWFASVNVTTSDAATSRNVMARSRGFCGYDWMVDSIVRDGAIYGPTQPKPELVTT